MSFNLEDIRVVSEDYKITPKTHDYLNIQKNKVTILNDGFVLVEKDEEDSTDISDSSFTTFGEFKIYVSTDTPNDYYCFNFRIPFLMTVNYEELIETGSYYIFKISGGKDLIDNNMHIESADNAALLLNKLFQGKFNKMLRKNYEDIPNAIMDGIETNGITGFQSIIYELMVSTLTRTKEDVTKEFRLIATENEPADNFRMINIREIPKNFSAMTALSSEGITNGILKSITNKKKGYVAQRITPQEKIVLGKV
jgi:hypothetical protein